MLLRQIARDGTTVILITHHVEEIFPEIGRVILLKNGRMAGDGPRHQMMAASKLSAVFGGPMTVEEKNGYYSATPG